MPVETAVSGHDGRADGEHDGEREDYDGHPDRDAREGEDWALEHDLLSLVRSSPKGVEEGDTPSSRPQPPSSAPPTVAEELTRDWYRLMAARKCSCGARTCVCRAMNGAAFSAAPDSGSGCDGRGSVAGTTPPSRDELPAPRAFKGRSRHGSWCPCRCLCCVRVPGPFEWTKRCADRVQNRRQDRWLLVVRTRACTSADMRPERRRTS